MLLLHTLEPHSHTAQVYPIYPDHHPLAARYHEKQRALFSDTPPHPHAQVSLMRMHHPEPLLCEEQLPPVCTSVQWHAADGTEIEAAFSWPGRCGRATR